MNFGDKERLIQQSQVPSTTESVGAEAMQKAEAFVRPEIHKLLERATDEPDKRSFAIGQITPFGKKVFKGKEEIFKAALGRINAAPYATDEELEEIFVRELASAILEFVGSYGFSEQQAKLYFRGIMQERRGFVSLDDQGVFSYDRYEGKIDLHITDGFTIPLFQGAMAKLAQIVRSDESMQTIKMTSWVVAKHSNVMKRFGFTIDEPLSGAALSEIQIDLPPEMQGKPIAEAHMTREDFLARYGVEK